MAAWVLLGLLTCWRWTLTSGVTGNSYLAYDCYGNVLSLSCKAGHRIKVIDDFFGFSPRALGEEGQCRYKKGDCTVTNGRFTSVIHRYCEGKQTCSNFQVDRRFCGTNQTNYEQVEYQCIPDADVTSFCDQAAYSVVEGYLSTPGFPGEYPPDRHCRCSLTSSRADVRVRLEATHFIVKFDHPCKDWLEISVGSHRRRLCGAYRSTLRSQAFNLTFHSDESQGHQGIWLHFALIPNDKNATIDVRCSSVPWPEVTTTTPVVTTTTLAQTTTTPEPSTSTTPSTTTVPTTPTSEVVFTTTGTDINTSPGENILPEVTTKFLTSSDSENEKKRDQDENEVSGSRRAPSGDVLKASRLLPEGTSFRNSSTGGRLALRPSRKGSSVETVHASTTSTEPPATTVTTKTAVTTTLTPTVSLSSVTPTEGVTNFLPPLSTEVLSTTTATTTPTNATSTDGSQGNTSIHEKGTTNDRASDMRKVAESKNAIRRKNNRITGIIIISICVGGIVLLIVILSVLLCINKRRQPKRQAEKERKKRLQQRLNSLSFYDSIPLYDSIGRKTGAAVAERSNEAAGVTSGGSNQVAGKAVNNTAPASLADDTGQVLDPKRLVWAEPNVIEEEVPAGASWAPGSGVESDHDSTIYSELEKPPVGPAKTPPVPPVPPRTLPNGEGPPGYSLHLASVDKNEDIYTHV